MPEMVAVNAVPWTLGTTLDGDPEERRRLQRALVVAVVAHLALLSLAAPQARRAQVPDPAPVVFRLEGVRFVPPEPPPVPPVTPRPEVETARLIPVPAELVAAPIAEVIELPPLDVAIPDLLPVIVAAPPPPPVVDGGPVEFRVGAMTAPVRVAGRDPRYTEPARRVRKEGTVIVRATIDREGRVTDSTLLRGLGFGLDEETLAALSGWRFTPATLDGRAVAVYYTLTVTFGLR